MPDPTFTIAPCPKLDSGPIQTVEELKVRIYQLELVTKWSANLSAQCVRNQQKIHSEQQQLYAQLMQISSDFDAQRPSTEAAIQALSTLETLELKFEQALGHDVNYDSIGKIIGQAKAAVQLLHATEQRIQCDIDKLSAAIRLIGTFLKIEEMAEISSGAVDAIKDLGRDTCRLPEASKKLIQR